MRGLSLGAILAPSLVLGTRTDGPRVVLYQDQWSLYGRQFSVYDLDDTVMVRDMPYSDLFLMHAFLYADPDTCLIHTTDRWGDFGWAMFDDKGTYDSRGRDQAKYSGTRGWFGYYNFLKDRYASSKNLHIMPSIGGWSLSYSLQECTQKKASTFLGQLIAHTKYWGWDGIDIDWEYPSCAKPCGCQNEYTCSTEKNGGVSTNNVSAPGDWAKYARFLSVLKTNLNSVASEVGKSKLYLSMALGMNPHFLRGDTEQYVDPTPIEWLCDDDSLDFLNMMTYDFFGTWLRKTGPLAPLYASNYPTADGDNDMNIHDSVTNVVSRCKNPQKLNMGLATYSKAWRLVPKTGDVPGFWLESSETTGGKRETNVGWQVTTELDKLDWTENDAAPKTGTLPWYEIVNNWFSQCERTWAPGSESPTLYCAQSKTTPDDTNVFVSYEDPESWYYKSAYAKRSQMGGVIIWTSGDFGGTRQMAANNNLDIGKPMWRAIYQGWFQDLSIDIGDAKQTGSGPGASWPYIGNGDEACKKDEPNCSCPLEPEKAKDSKFYTECKNKFTDEIKCDGCDTAVAAPTGDAPTKPVLPPNDCRRPAGLAPPKNPHDPLASYTQDQMGCAGSSAPTNKPTDAPTPATEATKPTTKPTPKPSPSSNDKASCEAKGCTWKCSS